MSYKPSSSSNAASELVVRDASGNFSAGTITATFSGTVTNAANIGITNDTTTNATMYPLWVTTTSGNLPAKISSTKITFNPSTATLTTTTFSGALSGNATTVTNGVYTTDNGTVTNTMLAGSIANDKLSNSAITINGSSVSLGGSTTVTASTTAALTVGTGLQYDSGTTFNGGTAKTISIDSTVATLAGTQTLTNKTVRSPIITIGSTTYTTGTASQSGTVIIGTGTTWTSSMIGGIIVWASGEHAFIRGFLDTTDLQGITSQTVADGPYTIYHSGIQADSRGNIGLEAGSTSILLGKPQINDIADKTKVIAFSLTGQTTNTQLTLATPISASRTITFPDATTTLVGQGTALGTPLSGILTNCSGTASGLTAGTVTTNANLTGVITSVGNATTITSQTGTGSKFVVDTSPTLVTPNLGTPSALVLTNATSLPAASVNAATSNSYTPSISAGPTFTMSTQAGGYRVIAGITHFWAHIDWSGKNGATTGQLSLTLPSAPTAADRIACYIGYASGMPSGAFIMGLAEVSTADVQFYKIVSGTTSGLLANDVSTGGAFYISGWYY